MLSQPSALKIGEISVRRIAFTFLNIFALFSQIHLTNFACIFLPTGALADLAALHFDAVNGVYLGILGLSFVQAAVQVILLSPGFLLSLPGILVGFPILGPYMLLHSPTATPSERQSSDRSATFAGALLALAMLACYGSAFSLGAPAETRDVYFYSSCLNFLRALADDPWLRITTVNAAALALTAAVPLAGDMSRRGWKFSGPQKTEALAALASIAALPGFGPALYLALRPAIQNGEELGE